MNKEMIVILCSSLLLSACGNGSVPSGPVSTPNVGPYTMTVLSERTSMINAQCHTISDYILECNKNYSGDVTIGFSFKGTPNFYIVTQTTNNNIEINMTPYDFTYVDPINGSIQTIPGNCSTTPQSSLSCDFSLTTTSGLDQPTTVDFIITGQAGESTIYKVIYQ